MKFDQNQSITDHKDDKSYAMSKALRDQKSYKQSHGIWGAALENQ